MIGYIVGKSIEDCAKSAAEKGWTRIGYDRFATPDKDDIRAVVHFGRLVLLPGKNKLIKAEGFDLNEEKARYEELVELGMAEWV